MDGRDDTGGEVGTPFTEDATIGTIDEGIGTQAGTGTGTQKRGRGRPRKVGGSNSGGASRGTASPKVSQRPFVSKKVSKIDADVVNTGVSVLMVVSNYIADKQPILPVEFNIVPQTALQDVYRISEDEANTLVTSILEILPALPADKLDKFRKYAPVVAAIGAIGVVVIPRYMAHNQIMGALRSAYEASNGSSGQVYEPGTGTSPGPTARPVNPFNENAPPF